jgi:sulfur carrier protein ThiS
MKYYLFFIYKPYNDIYNDCIINLFFAAIIKPIIINAKLIVMKFIIPDRSEVTIGVNGKTIEELLVTMDIDPLTVLIARGDEIIPEDTIPDEQDTIRIIRISHGG